MPNDRLCEIVVLLDRSGSMASIRADMEGGFAAFVEEQRKLDEPCVVSLYQFDDAFDVVYQERPLADVPPLVLRPRGATALLDAMGRTITMVGERLAAKPESERPGKVVIMVITDGHENRSREWTRDRVQALVEHQRQLYSWQFAFLGANMDAIAEAQTMGMSGAAAMDFQHNASGVRHMYKQAAGAMRSYRGAGGQSTGFTFQAEEPEGKS